MRRYESVVILDPDMNDEDVKAFAAKYSGMIQDHGGETLKIDDWGRKRLAYLVNKRDMGRYMLLEYLASASLIEEVERNFKIAEDVLKFLSVKLEDNVDIEAFRAEMEAKKAEAEAKAKAAEAEAQAKAAEAEAQAKAAEEAQAEPPAEPEAPAATAEAEEPPAEEPAAQPATEETTEAPAAAEPEEAKPAEPEAQPESQQEEKKEGDA